MNTNTAAVPRWWRMVQVLVVGLIVGAALVYWPMRRQIEQQTEFVRGMEHTQVTDCNQKLAEYEAQAEIQLRQKQQADQGPEVAIAILRALLR